MTQAARNSRRDGVQHKTGFPLSGLIFLIVVLFAISACSYIVIDWMRNSNYVPLSKLVITGDRQFTTNDDLRQVILAQGERQTFITQDVDQLQQDIKTKLPWVKQVSIRKHWPDELSIHVVEYRPYAYWNEQAFVDQDAQSFELPQDRIQVKQFPFFYGVEGQEKTVLDNYHEVNAMLAKIEIKLRSISLNDRHSWTLMLDNGIKLELGQQDKILRLKRFITLYPLLIEQTPPNQQINYVDMRYKSGAAVGYTPII